MTTKATTPTGQGEGCPSLALPKSTENIDKPRKYRQAIIRYYHDKGVVLSVPPNIKPKAPDVSIRRGKVVGWSKASRRRMRLALMTTQPIDEKWKSYGVTLTVPGPVMEIQQYRKLWDDFARSLSKYSLAAVWRVEIQRRGALHYHLLLWAPESISTRIEFMSQNRKSERNLQTEVFISVLWKNHVNTLGPVNLEKPYFGPNGEWQNGILSCGSRMAWPGANLHAVDVQTGEGSRGAWLRYLQDHATKAKQEQIPTNIGRHWGIIGRKWVRIIEPTQTDDLTMKQFWCFLRAFQRLCRPHIKSESSPFGTKLGFRSSRGSRGLSTWFSRPETIARISTWAKTVAS